MHGLAVAYILIEEDDIAAGADGVTRHHIAQHKTGIVEAQLRVIHLVAPHADRQCARQDGQRGAPHVDVVLG